MSRPADTEPATAEGDEDEDEQAEAFERDENGDGDEGEDDDVTDERDSDERSANIAMTTTTTTTTESVEEVVRGKKSSEHTPFSLHVFNQWLFFFFNVLFADHITGDSFMFSMKFTSCIHFLHPF